MAAFGLVREAPPPAQPHTVWPENWRALHVFADMLTQWNVGMSGPIGLRYESLPTVLRLRAVPRAEHAEVFDGVQVMEAEALAYWREQRNH